MVGLGNDTLGVESPDGKVQLCFQRLAAWIADQLENVTLNSI